jgi:hypothetical protein
MIDDPLASSCIFFQCKHMTESSITHVDHHGTHTEIDDWESASLVLGESATTTLYHIPIVTVHLKTREMNDCLDFFTAHQITALL